MTQRAVKSRPDRPEALRGGGVGLSRNNAESYHAPAREGWIGRNVIHHVREYGIAVKMARNSILSQNKIWRVRKAPSTSRGGGIYIGNNDHCNTKNNKTLWYYSDNVWAIFNHIYDVQTGVSIDQQVHCSGYIGCCPNARLDDSDILCCEPTEDVCLTTNGVDYYYEGPKYRPSQMYVVGNVFDHIRPFGEAFPDGFGQAVLVGAQVQARVVNNTIYKCSQGVQILCTHSIGPCPPDGDPDNSTRNTTVGLINNIILDPVNDGTNDSHVRVCTGPYAGNEGLDSTLTESDFDYNIHYPLSTMYVKLPNDINNFCASVACLKAYVNQLREMGWADHSWDNLDPQLADPGEFDFRATSSSNFGQLGRTDDPAYDAFESWFGRSIFHDYEGNTYNSTTCSIGAFADPDF